MSFAIENTPRISLSCKLVPVQYQGYEYGLFELWKSSVLNSNPYAQKLVFKLLPHHTTIIIPYASHDMMRNDDDDDDTWHHYCHIRQSMSLTPETKMVKNNRSLRYCFCTKK